APPGTRYGNRVTALRWVKILKSLGHRVTLSTQMPAAAGAPAPFDALVALHAGRGHEAIRGFRQTHPGKPLVVALTGTDLYRDIQQDPRVVESLGWADRIITLHGLADQALPEPLRPKVRLILQSAPPPSPAVDALRRKAQARWSGPGGGQKRFTVCVVGHLREEKDPFRAAMAAREMVPSSGLRVIHAGRAMNDEMAQRALDEMARNPRYRWVGELPPWRVRRLMASSRLMVLSSRLEGGANVISEAAALGLPVLASRIAGSVGLLGENYMGYFPPVDTRGLAKLLRRGEMDPRYLAGLAHWMRDLAPMFHPDREKSAWQALLDELTPRI
ncbi:MAG: selenosugar synthase SenB, partial [Deltaproteobacteria bacterium]|nr:selenosugar synthase SenB [Deltaproteobacteria bacterium]